VDTAAASDRRVEAIKFLTLVNPKAYEPLLKGLLGPTQPYVIQLEALNALSTIPGETVSRYLLANWPKFTPAIRDAAINTFLSEDERIVLLLDALEQEKVDQSMIG